MSADRVAFPDDVLTEEEDVVLHLHPHWKASVRPILVLLLALIFPGGVGLAAPEDGGAALCH